jgi:hypothetical protein
MSATIDHHLVRVGAVLVLVALAFLLTVGLGRVGAEAELADPVGGHAVVEPGGSLWAIAVDTAPQGVDPRAHLDAIRDLNGIEGSDVAAWTVVLLPAG